MTLSIGNDLPQIADERRCVGCMACLDICPMRAISAYTGSDGHDYVKVNSKICINCRQCERVCQRVQTNYGDNDFSKSRYFIGRAKDDLLIEHATSGGVFAAMAKKILKNGGAVVGAYLDGRKCYHKIIHEIDEIVELQGSKYMSSSMLGIYRKIEEELKKHPVLFSGLGCQCAAVIAYFSIKKPKHRLYTVDLICGGMPSKLLVDKFLEENTDISEIVSFRTKDKYELKVERKGTIQVMPGRPLPLYGFSREMTNRWSCYRCLYACGHRKTDVTIGDYWNKEKNSNKKIFSSLCIHNIENDFLYSEIDLYPVKAEDIAMTNPRLVIGEKWIPYPRKKLSKLFKGKDYLTLKKIYCMDVKFNDLLFIIYKVFRFLICKIEKYFIRKRLRRIFKRDKS